MRTGLFSVTMTPKSCAEYQIMWGQAHVGSSQRGPGPESARSKIPDPVESVLDSFGVLQFRSDSGIAYATIYIGSTIYKYNIHDVYKL